jgi:hypothetical protein
MGGRLPDAMATQRGVDGWWKDDRGRDIRPAGGGPFDAGRTRNRIVTAAACSSNDIDVEADREREHQDSDECRRPEHDVAP